MQGSVRVVIGFVFAYACVSLLAQTKNDFQSGVLTSSDIVADESGEIYFTAAESGSVYLISLPTNVLSLRPISAAQRLVIQPKLVRPTGIASVPGSPGKLLVCDSGAAAVLTLDGGGEEPLKRKATVLYRDDSLRGRCLVARSPSGIIAIGNSHADEVVLYDGRAGYRVHVPGLGVASELAFSGDRLLALTNGQLLSINFDAISPMVLQQSKRGILAFVLEITEPKSLRRFAVDRGVVYGLAASGLLVFAGKETKGLAYSLPSVVTPDDITNLTLFGGSLVLFDAGHDRIVSVPRLFPAAISLEGTAAQTAQGLVSVYEYMDSQRILPTRIFTADREYPQLREWLIELRIVLPSRDAPTSQASDDRITKLICALNPNFCPESLPTTSMLARTIVKDQRLRLPDVPKESSTVVRLRRLEGTSIADYIEQTSLSPEKYTTQYLSALNGGHLPTLEATLNNERFLLLTPPRSDLHAGSMVKLQKGKELVADDLEKCRVDSRPEIVALDFKLPSTATTTAGIEVLPRVALPKPQLDTVSQDIAQIEIQYDDPMLEKISLQDVAQQAQACLARASSTIDHDKVFLVTDLVRAKGIRYRLRRRDGRVIFPSSRNLLAWGLLGITDPQKEWSAIVGQPLAIAYKVRAPLFESAPVTWRDFSDPSLLKPGMSQDIRGKTGDFLLPVTSWQLQVLLPEQDVRTTTSALGAVAKRVHGMYVLPKEDLAVKEQATSFSAEVANSPLSHAIAERAALKASIHYRITDNDIRDLKRKNLVIGVAEKASETAEWQWHPHFLEPDGTSIWREVTKDSPLVPKQRPPSMSAIDPMVVKERPGVAIEADHGAHVAGLIAGRGKDILGLLPSADLLLVNTQTNSSSLDSTIDRANTNLVRIINFSQAIEVRENDPAMATLKSRIQTDWKETLLFVAAAGNNDNSPNQESGKDLGKLPGELALIKWVPEIPGNIIGVAAIDPRDDTIISKCQPDPAREDYYVPCSNYGKRFVQLTAPGLRVYSMGATNDYVIASGTSMAVPQVTAAAALLRSRVPIGISPARIKARLIYTADYEEIYIRDKSVWGGKLNIERAVTEPDQYVVVPNKKGAITTLVVIDPKWQLAVNGTGEGYDPSSDENEQTPETITATELLRLHSSPEGFWIVYVERTRPYRMKMIVHARVNKDSKIPCEEVWQWDPTTNGFAKLPDHPWLKNGIPIDDILDLVGPIPDNVHLPG